MRVVLIFIFLLFTSYSLNAQEVVVGLYNNYKVHHIELNHGLGTYTVIGDTIHLYSGELDKVKISASGDSLHIRTADSYLGKFSKIKITADNSDNYLNFKCIDPAIRVHQFEDNFEVSAKNGLLKMLNKVEMKDYLAGVIQSEGGGGRNLEYYKVQALISRTYLLKNLNRHSKDGFQVCDATHCQAYHNKHTSSQNIRTAIKETNDEILVSPSGKILGTYFSANCGGQTSDASFVWNNSLSYCTPFIDTFCIHTRQSKWTEKISIKKWEHFLNTKYALLIDNDEIKEMMYSFTQEERKAFYIHPSLGIPLRDIRSKFGLRSTFFDVKIEGENVVLEGRGFGHGIGLCQEGAMEMGNQKFSYKQIAKFYFNDVKIMSYDEFLFYKEENSDSEL